jgi:hypothetical protein
LIVPLAIGVGAYSLAETSAPSPAWFVAMILGLMAAWLIGSFVLVRLAGYGLAWRWRFSGSSLDAVPSATTDPAPPSGLEEAWIPRWWPRCPPTAVPRRFGVGSLLVVTAVLALFLGVVRWIVVQADLPPIIIGAAAAYIVVVGVGQAVLFGGKSPRKASVIVGMPCLFVILMAWAIHEGLTKERDVGYIIWESIGIAAASIIFGAPCGYCAGGWAAGVFLIIERVWGRLHDADDDPDDDADD